MAFKVVMTVGYTGIEEFVAQHKRELVQMGAEYLYQPCHTEDEIVAAAHDADALITVSFMQPITRRLMERLSRCRFIQTQGVGYEGVDVQAATELGICVANVPDYCLEEVSDHAMALLLACSRRVVQSNNAVRAGKWVPANIDTEIRSQIWPKLSRLKGQTLGLIGFGRIPRALVPKAKGFGLNVIAYDPYVSSQVAKEFGVELVDIDRLLRESDFVSVHAAMTPETKHMIGWEQLKKMKPTAYLISTARGPIVDQQALYKALKDGLLAGAALDVTAPEPIARDDPLLKLDNVIITPHVGAISPTSWAEFWHRPVEEVGRIMRGEWPRGLVNPQAKARFVQKWGPMR